MPDVRYYKLFLAEYKKKYKKVFHETKTIELQRFLDRIEFYADRCALEPRIKSQNYRWFEYNNAVRSAIRIWEKHPYCSEPPTNNPDPLNGLEELKKWAIKELRKAGANIEYIALDIATRTITVGTESTTITSERVWDFIKDLVSATKSDRIVPVIGGAQNNKHNIDQLRRKVGKDNLKKLVISTGDGYKLSPNVKVLNSGQVSIRKTKLKRQRAT